MFDRIRRSQAARFVALRAQLRGNLERALKREAPRDTGALARSIEVGPNASVTMEDYGFIQDSRGPHEGWIRRAAGRAVRRTDF